MGVFERPDTAFDLALGPRAARTASLGKESAIATERLESWIPHDLAGLAIVGDDQRRSVVAKDLLGESTKVPECPVEALEPVILPLGEKRPALEPA